MFKPITSRLDKLQVGAAPKEEKEEVPDYGMEEFDLNNPFDEDFKPDAETPPPSPSPPSPSPPPPPSPPPSYTHHHPPSTPLPPLAEEEEMEEEKGEEKMEEEKPSGFTPHPNVGVNGGHQKNQVSRDQSQLTCRH